MRRRCKAFTLVEMVIVISILLILLAITIPNYLVMSERAEVDRVAKGIASMITEMYEKIDSEMAYYKYFVVINNWAKEIEGKKYLEVKLIKIENNNVITLKQLVSRRVKLKSISGYKIADQLLSCITYNNRLLYSIFDVNSEEALTLAPFTPITYDTMIEVVSISVSNIKKKITIKAIPTGSVVIE